MRAFILTPKYPKVVPTFNRLANFSSESSVARWLFDMGFEIVKYPKNADMIVYIGGPDIHPKIYDQPKHPSTGNPDLQRDVMEINMFRFFPDKFKLGICRGAQMLNCMSGGSIIQHHLPSCHRSNHGLIDVRNETQFYGVPSTHHQLMLPSPNVADREIIGLAYNFLNKTTTLLKDSSCKKLPREMRSQTNNFFEKYSAPDFDARSDDLEIVYYNNSNSLCIQSHPERATKDFRKYCSDLVLDYITRERKSLCADTSA